MLVHDRQNRTYSKMAKGKVNAINTSILLIGFFCLALLLISSEAADVVFIGQCSQFPDCNAACIKEGYQNGVCTKIGAGILGCYCADP